MKKFTGGNGHISNFGKISKIEIGLYKKRYVGRMGIYPILEIFEKRRSEMGIYIWIYAHSPLSPNLKLVRANLTNCKIDSSDPQIFKSA